MFSMPLKVGDGRLGPTGEWAPERLAQVFQEPVVDARGPSDVLGDQDPVVVVDAECTPVEGFVVEGAEGYPVVLVVCAIGSMPPDVGRIDTEVGVF